MTRPTTTRPGHLKRTIIVYPETNTMLEQIASATGHSASQIIRELIRAAYQMRFQRFPQCAQGTPCLCPGMHQYQQPPAPVGGNLAASPVPEHPPVPGSTSQQDPAA